MGVLNAVLSLQEFRCANPTVPLADCARLLAYGLANRSGFDYPEALHLNQVIPDCCNASNCSRRSRLQNLIEQVIRADDQPSWAMLIPKGRRYVETYLRDSNSLHCLQCAGLYEKPLPQDIAEWWLRLANLARSVEDTKRAQTGMRGEQLTVISEKERLRSAGHPDLLPECVSIEDNTLGYDVTSFDIVAGQPSDLFIEVKACSSRPLRFFVSRGEWRTATEMRERFLFHIWDLSNTGQGPMVITPDELSVHLPTDRGEGVWKTVEVTL